MFRPMRRGKQLLPPEESIQILEQGTSGVLAVAGDAGYPYAVPLSYVYMDGKAAISWMPSAATARLLFASLAKMRSSLWNIPPISAV